PLVAFALQAGLLEGDGTQLAACALALAAVYAALAWWQRRRGSPHVVLMEAHTLLAGGFAIPAAPLALSARATAAVFAVEGAGLDWLGGRIGRRLPRWTGAGLQVAAGRGFLVGAAGAEDTARVLLNPLFAGALLIAAGGFASAWWLHGERRGAHAVLFHAWGLAWWAGAVGRDIGAHVPEAHQPDALLAASGLTALLAA